MILFYTLQAYNRCYYAGQFQSIIGSFLWLKNCCTGQQERNACPGNKQTCPVNKQAFLSGSPVNAFYIIYCSSVQHVHLSPANLSNLRDLVSQVTVVWLVHTFVIFDFLKTATCSRPENVIRLARQNIAYKVQCILKKASHFL